MLLLGDVCLASSSHCHLVMGSGTSIFVWLDPRAIARPLLRQFGMCTITNLGSRMQDKLGDIYFDGQLHIQPPLYLRLQLETDFLEAHKPHFSSADDAHGSNLPTNKFFFKKIALVLRTPSPMVRWKDLVCCKNRIGSFSFASWMNLLRSINSRHAQQVRQPFSQPLLPLWLQ